MRTSAATLVALVLSAPGPALASPAKERSEIPQVYKWNLADLFPTAAAFDEARADAARQIAGLSRFRGTLGTSARSMLRALEAIWKVNLALDRLSVYASSLADEDTRAAHPLEWRQATQKLYVDFAAETSFLGPEVLALGSERVEAFLSREPRLAPWRFFLLDTLRLRSHTVSESGERLIALEGDVAGAGEEIHGLLEDADLPWPRVKLSTGEVVRLDPEAFEVARQSRIAADRDLAFSAFFGALKTYERTFGATLYSAVKALGFTRLARNYASDLEAALFPNAIPVEVYKKLVSSVRENLPTFHRYLLLRRKMLGVERLRYQDLYVPLVKSVDLRFDPEQARAIVLASVAPLGKKYVEGLAKGFRSGWTDYLPSVGKRPGAYSTGVYGVHPFQLLNFNGTYDDLSTLAHESGHSMHTALAYEAQPYPTASYPSFVAEVASTLNENLLFHHMLMTTTDEATRLALLGEWLENARTTLFRQAQFADFELAMHEKAERGETLTGDNLSKLYLDITRLYYGQDEGICEVEPLLAIEWAYIPHFYSPFYVYEYATSFVASTALARGIREEALSGAGTARRDAYLAMLSAGGSKYPLDLLAEAGIDMTSSKPLEATISEMNATMDEMERLLARTQKTVPQAP